jgi:UDP-N-acetylmuramate--alanine ligase
MTDVLGAEPVAVPGATSGLFGATFVSNRFHFVGVAGAGVSGLARLLAGSGCVVTGSDGGGGAVLDRLAQEGLDVWTGCRPDRIAGADGYVVRSAAVPLADPEVQECVRRGFTSLLYAEAVGRLSEGRRTLAIAGTHGKTTTTGLTVAALRGAGVDPSHLIGGEVPELGGNGRWGHSQEFVVEACEFNRSFHNLRPFGAAILNVDHDHFDCFPSTTDLVEAFAGYLARVRPGGTALVEEGVPRGVLAELRSDVRILTVGSGLYCDVRAVDVRDDLGRFSFVPMVKGRRFPRVQLALSGRHNMHNALFALGLCWIAGADLEGACRGVGEFGGVRRRFEMHAGPRGGTLVNDYAHHPAELRAVLTAARQRFPGRRLLAVFQPHQHQRTLHLLQEFAEALTGADAAYIVDIYGAREAEHIKASVSARDLVAAIRSQGGEADAVGAVDAAPAFTLARHRPDDIVLLLGAGDIDRALGGIVAGI